MFVEVVFAPGYDEDAFELLAEKPNVRLLENQERREIPVDGARPQARARRDAGAGPRHGARGARGDGGRDRAASRAEEEWGELLFAMRVCKHVRSNAIVLAKRAGHGRASARAR